LKALSTILIPIKKKFNKMSANNGRKCRPSDYWEQ